MGRKPRALGQGLPWEAPKKPTPSALDPIIQGLLMRLPAPGSLWAPADRKVWLNLLEGSFNVVYKDAPPVDAPSGHD